MAVSRALITGHLGQLGHDLMNLLGDNMDVTGVDLPLVDIRDKRAVDNCIRDVRPDVVLHAAAYTDVDGCESDKEFAFSVNAEGTENVALACRKSAARMIYFSTDYVFDGNSDSAYVEDDQPEPKTVYGKSKWEGEQRITSLLENYVIMRIAWVYGCHGKNFVKTIIRLADEQRKQQASGKEITPLRVVDDQLGNPTWTVDIARQVKVVLDNDLQGLYHSTAEKEVSWYQFACDIFECLDWKINIEPCSSNLYPRPAPRPHRSSLHNRNLELLGLNIMRDYREALQEFMNLNMEILLNEL
jgi:dTDP-4-dehydrorhamnose reductase